MKNKNPRLYGLLIDPDGRIRYAEIPFGREEKWSGIKSILKATVTKQLPAGGFNGINRILVYNYYGTRSAGINEKAMKLTGGKTEIYGPALLFRESTLGYPAPMSESASYKMKLEVERGW